MKTIMLSAVVASLSFFGGVYNSTLPDFTPTVEAAHVLAYFAVHQSHQPPEPANASDSNAIEVVEAAVEAALASRQVAPVPVAPAPRVQPSLVVVSMTPGVPCPNCDKVKKITSTMIPSGWAGLIRFIDVESYPADDPWKISGPTGTVSVPVLLVLRGDDVIDVARVSGDSLVTVRRGSIKLTAAAVADWVNSNR